MSYLVDIVGSLSIVAKSEDMNSGVTTDLSVSCIRAGKEGEELTLYGRCDKRGKRLAYTRVDMYVFPDVVDGEAAVSAENAKYLVASGRHTKYIVDKPRM
jgi:acyl-coenzyme A thioesterase PaaI-like protein